MVVGVGVRDGPDRHREPGRPQSVASGLPLLVCDLYEHSYALDFGAVAAKYVDAFWANVDWAVVDRRLARAEAISL